MASRRSAVTAATADAISTEEIRRVDVPSVVNMWASCVTNGDTIGLLLNRTEIMPTDEMNIEISGDVIDTAQSVVLDQAENRLHAQKALLEMLIK